MMLNVNPAYSSGVVYIWDFGHLFIDILCALSYFVLQLLHDN